MQQNYALVHRLLNVQLLAIVFLYNSPQVAVAGPSAAEILTAMKSEMSKPLQYRVVSSGIEMTIYQKMLPNGSMASLTEIAVPFKQINLAYDDKNYEVYPEHRIAIDRHFLHRTIKNQAAAIVSSLENAPAESSRIVGEVIYDGKNSYEIESTLTSRAVEGLVKANVPVVKEQIPVKFRYVIDTKTYLLLKMEFISGEGSVIAKVEYKDIKSQPGLSDEFFMLPPGFEVKQPKSVNEYMDITASILSPKLPPVMPPPPKFKPVNRVPDAGGSANDVKKRRNFALYAFLLVSFTSMAAVVILLRLRNRV